MSKERSDAAKRPLDRRVRGAELYMDMTDFEHELGNCTVALYASVEDLKASRICAAECGIVAVRVELLRAVEPGRPYSERGESTPNAQVQAPPLAAVGCNDGLAVDD